MLAQASSSPDYLLYLTYLYSTSRPPPELGFNEAAFSTVRFSAAVNLKNVIKGSYKSIPRERLASIKSAVIVTLQDPNPQIQGFTGTIMTEIVQQGGLLQWPEIVPELLALVGNDSGRVPVATQEGAMSALNKVCEDNKKLLDRDYQGSRPINMIVPRLLQFSTNPQVRIQVFALKTLKSFIAQRPEMLMSNIEAYLTTLFQLANERSPVLRSIICQTLVQLVDTRPDAIQPHLPGLVDYIVVQQQCLEDPDLQLDATEFWLSIGEQNQLKHSLGPYLQRIVPVLLDGMVYSEDDIERLGGQHDDAEKEDRVEDLKPQFAKAKVVRGAAPTTGVPANETNGHSVNGTNAASTDLSDGEIEESDEEEEDGDPEDSWSLRKCSAAALDIFATIYHQPVFEIILPYLKQNLTHSEWPKREAAVLALGAVAEGCMDVVSPHLPELVPFLISRLDDDEAIVRQITCWCLGRYSEWASSLEKPIDKSQFFEPMMEGLLRRMLDNTKRVQEAAASAFASLEEKAGMALTPYLEPILKQFSECFSRYKDRNMYILYDCVQMLAQAVATELTRPSLQDLLMPALIARWNKINDQSREMITLLECLGFVAAAYGDDFSRFAPTMFTRCIGIIFENLNAYMASVNNPALDQPDKDFLSTSLDLLSAIIQAIDPVKSQELITSSQPSFYELLAFCLEDSDFGVRQSAYALLGDCAIHVYPSMQPYLPRLLPIMIKQIDLDMVKDEDSESGFDVINNACWACGELGEKGTPGELSPFIESLYQGLATMVKTEGVPETVEECAAMSLGRMGINCSEHLAPHLSDFADSFLGTMTKVYHSQEKASAFIGFNKIIEKNPRAMESCLGDYFSAIGSFPKKELTGPAFAELRTSFGQVCCPSLSLLSRTLWLICRHR